MKRIPSHQIGMAALLIGILGTGAGPAEATISPAASYALRGGSTNLGGYNIGWEFTTDRDLLVTHLGMWDQSADGNAITHDVGIWDASSNLVVSGTVLTTDNTVTSFGGPAGIFLYHDIPDFYLPEGTYLISGTTGGAIPGGGSSTPDGWHSEPIGLTSPPAISIGPGYNSDDTGLVLDYPDRINDGNGLAYFGPNFMFDEVPEPSTILLLAAGGLLLYRRGQRGNRAL